jgi:hypothetical protein
MMELVGEADHRRNKRLAHKEVFLGKADERRMATNSEPLTRRARYRKSVSAWSIVVGTDSFVGTTDGLGSLVFWATPTRGGRPRPYPSLACRRGLATCDLSHPLGAILASSAVSQGTAGLKARNAQRYVRNVGQCREKPSVCMK